MTAPIVSFAVSVYNDEAYLPDCIDGINSQTFQDYEVVVVDDGSSDRTHDILSEWQKQNDRVCIISRQNGGLTSALNLAISQARGRYIARQDADDISSPSRLQEQVRFLNLHQEAVLAATQCVEFDDLNKVIILYYPPDNPAIIKRILCKGENPLVHGSIMFRKSAFESLQDGYRFLYAQDYDLYLRISSLGELRIVPEILYGLRNHSMRTAIQVRTLKDRIRRLIMQVNGLIPWDAEMQAIFAEYGGTNPPWQRLQEQCIKSTPSTPEAKTRAQYFLSLVGDNIERNKYVAALQNAMRSIESCPTWGKTWASLPYALIGVMLPNSLKSQWRNRGFVGRYRKGCYDGLSLQDVFSGHVSKRG